MNNAAISSKSNRNKKKKAQKRRKGLRMKLSGSDLVRDMEVFSSTMNAGEMKEYHAAIAKASLERAGRGRRSTLER